MSYNVIPKTGLPGKTDIAPAKRTAEIPRQPADNLMVPMKELMRLSQGINHVGY
jgi:hypothetical protein